jgi:TetR/AcrR family transcriptional regulator, transcriptional repressor for nem operon
MGRTSDARERILSTGSGLIETRGYSALGIAEICSAAGVPKGSFYYFFASKEAMALAVIDEQWAEQKKMWTGILDGDGPPLVRMRQWFEATEAAQRAGQQSCGSVAGCMFGNLTLELSNQTEAIRSRLQGVFDEQAAMVAAVIGAALDRREVAVADVPAAACGVLAQLEGQVMFAKLYNDTGRLGALWGNCLALLGARVPVDEEAVAGAV